MVIWSSQRSSFLHGIHRTLWMLRQGGWETWKRAHPSIPALILGSIANSASGDDEKGFKCPKCSRAYKLKSSLRNHEKWECGKDPQFPCPFCSYRAKQKMHVARHIERMHKKELGLYSETSIDYD